MKKDTTYSRKISAKEARKGFIFILKGNLPFFPPLGDKFKFINDDSYGEVRLESYHCTCRGPDLPHEHYFIRWEGLKAGDMVEITKKSHQYHIKIKNTK
jgi:hypothetical protein